MYVCVCVCVCKLLKLLALYIYIYIYIYMYIKCSIPLMLGMHLSLNRVHKEIILLGKWPFLSYLFIKEDKEIFVLRQL